MDEFLIVGTTQMQTNIYMSGLSIDTLMENGIHDRPAGLYLYEVSEELISEGIRVLAHVTDAGAAYRLLDLMGVNTLP
jgi:hypothetical protein